MKIATAYIELRAEVDKLKSDLDKVEADVKKKATSSAKTFAQIFGAVAGSAPLSSSVLGATAATTGNGSERG